MSLWRALPFAWLLAGCGGVTSEAGASSPPEHNGHLACRACQGGTCPVDVVAEMEGVSRLALTQGGIVVSGVSGIALATTQETRVLHRLVEGKGELQQIGAWGGEAYWQVNDLSGSSPFIQVLRVPLDGPDSTPELVIGGDTGPTSFVLDDDGIFFGQNSNVVHVDPGTKTVRTLTTGGGLQMATDEDRVYWPGCSTGYSSVKKDGSDLQTFGSTLPSSTTCTQCLTVDRDRVYAADGDALVAFQKRGDEEWTTLQSPWANPCEMVSNDEHLYSRSMHGLVRIPAGGGAPELIVERPADGGGVNAFGEVGVEGDCVYWANPRAGKVYTTSIRR